MLFSLIRGMTNALIALSDISIIRTPSSVLSGRNVWIFLGMVLEWQFYAGLFIVSLLSLSVIRYLRITGFSSNLVILRVICVSKWRGYAQLLGVLRYLFV